MSDIDRTIKWDRRFLRLARTVSRWSKDPSTQVGAVITSGNRLVSVGFNGFPQKMNDTGEFYEDRSAKYSRVVHAEINALIFAERVVAGYTLYTWPCGPCDRCTVQMIQAGISLFVFPECPAEQLSRWEQSLALSKTYIEEAGAKWREYESIEGE